MSRWDTTLTAQSVSGVRSFSCYPSIRVSIIDPKCSLHRVIFPKGIILTVTLFVVLLFYLFPAHKLTNDLYIALYNVIQQQPGVAYKGFVKCNACRLVSATKLVEAEK